MNSVIQFLQAKMWIAIFLTVWCLDFYHLEVKKKQQVKLFWNFLFLKTKPHMVLDLIWSEVPAYRGRTGSLSAAMWRRTSISSQHGGKWNLNSPFISLLMRHVAGVNTFPLLQLAFDTAAHQIFKVGIWCEKEQPEQTHTDTILRVKSYKATEKREFRVSYSSFLLNCFLAAEVGCLSRHKTSYFHLAAPGVDETITPPFPLNNHISPFSARQDTER